MAKKNKKKDRAEKMNAYMNSRERGGGGADYLPDDVARFTVKEADMYEVDIIPFEVMEKDNKFASKGDTWYELSFAIHRNIGTEEELVVCPKSISKKLKCPICERVAEMRKDPRYTKEDINALRAKDRQLFNVLDPDGKILLWDISTFLLGELLDKTIKSVMNHKRRPRPEVASFFELEEGMTLEIDFEEKDGGGYKFTNAIKIDFFERDDLDENLLDESLDLDNVLIVHDYETLLEKFLGVPSDDEEEEEDEQEEEEEKPKRGRSNRKSSSRGSSRKSSRGRKKDDDGESDEEEEPEAPDDEDEEEAEEKKPKKGRGRSSKSSRSTRSRTSRRNKSDDEADDAEDDGDADEEEKPKKNTRRGRGATDEEEEENPKRGRRGRKDKAESKPKRGRGKKKNECPEGHKFGVDTDEEDKCEECPVWEACMDAKEDK